MELDTHERFRCVTATWLQLPWWNSKADCITRVSKLRRSWRFLKFSEALHVYPNRFYVRNQVSQKAKGEILNWDAIANPKRAIQVQAMFSTKKKKTLTGDTDDQKFNCDNADGHSQAGNRKKKLSPSWIWKTSRKNKSNEKRLETLFTHRRSNIYLHKLPFIVDLTDIKSWIVFKFSQWTDDFCYFNDAKYRSNISINVSTQSIIRAVRINANFLKSCQLLLYLEFCIVQEFLARIKHWVDFTTL